MTALLFKALEEGIGTMLHKGGPGSGRHPEGGKYELHPVTPPIKLSIKEAKESYRGEFHHDNVGDYKGEVHASGRLRAPVQAISEPISEAADADAVRAWLKEHEEENINSLDASEVQGVVGEVLAEHPLDAEKTITTEMLAAAARRATPSPFSVASDVDLAAHAAATSPTNLRDQPTDGQKDAGNYKKGSVTISGLHLSIENPQGSIRTSKTDVDPPWESEIKGAHYGYLKGVVGQDKDHLDVFLKPSTPADFAGSVYVVHQVDQGSGEFDEHKVMLGYASQDEAVAAYKENYPSSWKVGPVEEMTLPDFKKWTAKGSVVQRLFGSQRAVAFTQPAPFLSKGGPGSGRHKEGDRVARSPKIWKPGTIPDDVRHGTVLAVQPGKDNQGRPVPGYLVVSDRDKAGVLNHFTGKTEPATGTWFAHSELVASKKINEEEDLRKTGFGLPIDDLVKDVTTGTGLSTPQAGLTHYDRRTRKVLREEDSDEAFQHNVGVEVAAGKSQEQAVAIAYSVQREAKKKNLAVN